MKKHYTFTVVLEDEDQSAGWHEHYGLGLEEFAEQLKKIDERATEIIKENGGKIQGPILISKLFDENLVSPEALMVIFNDGLDGLINPNPLAGLLRKIAE